MRLRRLELTRYGKFTDQHIDFGERTDGQTDLHLVYGPNEAGKSTALSAFLDLLFGIEPRSRFNFLHSYQAMRIGAILQIGGVSHSLCRIKRTQNSLLDGNDRVVPEQIIAGHLGGIDRESYRAMFSLDDDTLEAGGENILASRGDLGELLFSATAGLADLSQSLANLREEAEGFYKPHARSTELAELKAAMSKLKQDREVIDTAATKYAALTDARDNAKTLYHDALAARGAIQTRMDEVQRYVTALPRLAALRTLRSKILPLADLPEAPAGWLDELTGLQAEESKLSALLEAGIRDIAARVAELEAMPIDEAALGVADQVDAWMDARARAITAAKDIPERHIEVRREDLAIATILGRLGQAEHANPRDLILAASTVGTLRALLEKRSGIEADLKAAQREFGKAQTLLDGAKEALESIGVAAAPSQHLFDAVAAAAKSLRSDNPQARYRIAERTLAACRDEASERLDALRPWQGDLDQLAALAVPDDTQIEAWKTALAAGQKKQERHEAEAARLEAERRRLEAELAAITDIAGVVSDQEAASIRAAREAAWAGHRMTLDAASANVFETALRRDDIITQTRQRHETETARLHQANLALAPTRASEAMAREGLQAALAMLAGLHREIAAAIAVIAPTLPPATTLPQLEIWLAKRGRALETRARLQQAGRDLHEAATDCDTARLRLSRALAAAGVAHEPAADSETLLSLAQSALDQETETKSLRKQIQERERDLKARKLDFDNAAAADEQWQSAWAAACDIGLLRGLGSPDHVVTVREILDAVADLAPALDRRALLLDRIEKMQQDELTFSQLVAGAAKTLGMQGDGIPPLDLDRKITHLVRAARAAREAKAEKSQALDAVREHQRGLHGRAEIHARRRAEMTTHFGVGSLAEVAARLRDLERRGDLRKQAEEAERDILDAIRVPSITEAETLLDAADRAVLEAELAALKTRYADHDRRVQQLFADHSRAEDQIAAVGGDAAVAKIEEQRRTVLLHIEEGAKRYLKLRAGVTAAEYALRAYRQHHRSAMMARASEAFRTISRGAYSGLSSQPDRDNEVLVAVAADGASKIAPKLSKGTRFQLYLALRVAGYHEYARLREPVPFIADDIMETFDDFRAEATLRVFADMSLTGQVIYLTHHRHLCDIARAICPQIQLHTLVP